MLKFFLTVFCAVLVLPSPLMPNRAVASLFGDFTVKDERELGEKFNTLVKSRLPIIEDPEIAGYVRDVVKRIEGSMPPIPFDLSTSVVRNNSLNAFAAPAGYVFVFTGLIHHFEHEDELAAVIAHEMAHVSRRHIASRIEKARMVSFASMVGSLAGIFLGMSGQGEAGEALVAGSQAAGYSAMLKYSRQDEEEADQVGMLYLINAGYSPWGMVGAFEKIKQVKWLSGTDIAPYMSTHPGVNERIAYLEDRIRTMPEELQSRKFENERFRRIQTLVRARYLPVQTALSTFEEGGEGCMNLLGLAILRDRQNKISAAEADFERALACDSGNSLVLREAGRFHFKHGEQDTSARLLQKAVLKNPGDLIALFYYARILQEKGEYGNAETYYRRILDQLPEDGEVHYYFGRMLGESGDTFGAHLHLAYAAIYSLDKKQASFHMDKASRLAGSPEQQEKLKKLKEVHKRRSEYW
jgi:predicted Zn-dependent protease